MEEDRMRKKIFTQELEGTRRRGRPRKRWKEEVERDIQMVGVRRWRELVADRKKMEGHCSTSQSPQWAVVAMEQQQQQQQQLVDILLLRSFIHIAYLRNYNFRHFSNYSICNGGPGSSVDIATDYGLDGPGSNPGGDEIFLPSRPTLGSTLSPVKWVPGLSRG